MRTPSMKRPSRPKRARALLAIAIPDIGNPVIDMVHPIGSHLDMQGND